MDNGLIQMLMQEHILGGEYGFRWIYIPLVLGLVALIIILTQVYVYFHPEVLEDKQNVS